MACTVQMMEDAELRGYSLGYAAGWKDAIEAAAKVCAAKACSEIPCQDRVCEIMQKSATAIRSLAERPGQGGGEK
jgi:hypothetical protein